MAKTPSFQSFNHILQSLPPADRQLVGGACDTAELPFGEPLCQPGEAIRHVYFPTHGYISLITPNGETESLEVGMVGNEGLFGITLLLGVNTSGLLGLVQGSGQSLRMTASRFKMLADDSKPFRRILNRYLYVLTAQLAQTAACGRFHLLDARMARWLLMTQDRAHKATFRITHEFLAYMLGMRRAGITEAAGRLQAQGLIRYVRGELTVNNRAGLEAASCPCYRAMKGTYEEHLGKPKSRKTS
jgi:CRP-like cAMP-binding protein